MLLAYMPSIFAAPSGSATPQPVQQARGVIRLAWLEDGPLTASRFFNIISYLPIALYAENMRVRKALMTSVSTAYSIAPALTGCVKDLHSLWDVDEWDLFDDFGASKRYNVVSLRHGNSFPSTNCGLLELAGLIGTRKLKAENSLNTKSPPVGRSQRSTTVSVHFVTQSGLTGLQASSDGPWWLHGLCKAASIGEVVLLLSLMGALAYFGMIIGSLLMLSMVTNTVVLLFMQYKTSPVFANSGSMRADLEKTAMQGAALDVQIISASWNSTHLDVLCGYSSQIHSLTNLPVRSTKPWVIPLGCRIIAISLLAQAALLASQIGASDINAVIPSVWLAVYLLMLVPQKVIRSMKPDMILQKQPGIVNSISKMSFSGRRAALCFIAMLPVTTRAGRWDWLDVFMPLNERRQVWQEELETCGLVCRVDPRIRPLSEETKGHIEEALIVYTDPEVSKYVSAYKQTVRAA